MTAVGGILRSHPRPIGSSLCSVGYGAWATGRGLRGVGCEAWAVRRGSVPGEPRSPRAISRQASRARLKRNPSRLTHRPRSPAGGAPTRVSPSARPTLGPIVVSDAGAGNLVLARSWPAQRASIQTQKGKPRRLNGEELRMERTPVQRSGGGGPSPWWVWLASQTGPNLGSFKPTTSIRAQPAAGRRPAWHQRRSRLRCAHAPAEKYATRFILSPPPPADSLNSPSPSAPSGGDKTLWFAIPKSVANRGAGRYALTNCPKGHSSTSSAGALGERMPPRCHTELLQEEPILLGPWGGF
jgi:hypothetical protein